jgi:hypothetical protein
VQKRTSKLTMIGKSRPGHLGREGESFAARFSKVEMAEGRP